MAKDGAEQIQIGDGSLRIGDRVVYPNQGICRITGVEEKVIAGQSWRVVTLSREEDGATVMVPVTKVMGIGLRKVANVEAIDEVFDYLASPTDDPQLDWKVRHRENADKMTGGGLFGTAEVLKGLHALSRVRPLPQKERELYDSARHLIVGEIAAAMNIPVAIAENNLDYALFPPPGMKRKGKDLAPAAIPATGPMKRGEDDDLGFDDEAGEEEEAEAPKAKAAGGDEEEEETDDDAGEEKPAKPAKPPKAAKAPAAAKTSPPAAAAKPLAAAAPAPPAKSVEKPLPPAKPAAHAHAPHAPHAAEKHAAASHAADKHAPHAAEKHPPAPHAPASHAAEKHAPAPHAAAKHPPAAKAAPAAAKKAAPPPAKKPAAPAAKKVEKKAAPAKSAAAKKPAKPAAKAKGKK